MRYSLVYLLLFLAFQSFAQPINDDCDGIIDLGIAPYCPDITMPGNESEIYDNVGATATDIGFGNNTSCFNGGITDRDVWFAFTTSDTIFDYTITVMGVEGPDGTPSIVNPQVALYRGSCGFDGLAELLCASAELGSTMVELDAEGLTPGVTYFLRINDYSASATPNDGAFKLCIDEIDPVNLITEGSSSSCTGVLYDSGGPDGDYENGENSTFVICPSQPNQCITFGLTYYNIEDAGNFGIADQLLFYDGDEAIPGTEIVGIGGSDFATGISSGGAVCFEVQASSGCLTVQFVSDGTTTFEGFEGMWECSTQACDPIIPISVDATVDNQQIIDALSTPQTQVTITDINCDNGSYGTFLAGDNSDLGIEKGLLLTNGDAANAIGPNTDDGFDNLNADRFQPGDSDLDILSDLFGEGTLSQDACVIELDVYANTDELAFEYIFGSEEYPEFVDQTFNDIFAFLISGPDINGIPEINNQFNMATLPDNDNTLVQINSVNNLENWEYYRNNQLGQSLQYDGLTSDYLGVKKSLTARATVTPCNTYHLKLAIADRGDGIFDSGVFISDLRAGTPQIDVVFNSGIDYLIETCTDTPDEIVFRLTNEQDEAFTYNVVVTGTATQGEDYILEVPSQLTFQPGLNEIGFPITVLDDLDDMEGVENISIQLTNDFGCGTVVLGSLDIELHDILTVDINAGQDTARYCDNTSLGLMVEGAAQYFWTPVGIFDNPLSTTPTVTPTGDGWINVEGQVGAVCIAVDSIYLLEVDPMIDIVADTLNICLGDSIQLVAENNSGGQAISWSPATTITDPTSEITTVFPEINTVYTATLSLAEECIVMDSVLVDVDILNIPSLISDSTICQHSTIVLSTLDNPDVSTTDYQWIPEAGLDNPNSPTPNATPQTTTNYQLISTTTNGACADTSDFVQITVLPADADIQGADTIYLCVGEVANLEVITSTGNNQNFYWLPDDGSLSSLTDLSVVASPTQHTTYYTNFTVGECFVMDSVVIRVDSLPEEIAIMADPDKDPYCLGELVQLTSPIYEPALYPEITHQWEGLGLETPDSLYNMVFTTIDTFTYSRLTVNGGCSQLEEYQINVITGEGITLEPAQTVICPGESVNLVATSPQGGDFEWTPAESLSCSDCPDPIASPDETTNYMLTIDISDCEIEQSALVIVATPPVIDLIDDQFICPGETILLNLGPDEFGTTYTWTAQNDPAFSSSLANLEVSPTSSETYFLTVENECTPEPVTGQITITVAQAAAIVSIGEDQTHCAGETFTLNAVMEPVPSIDDRLSWFYDGENGSGVSSEFIATNTGYAVFNYTFRTNTSDCGLFRDSILITVLDSPTLALIADQVICSADVSDIALNNGPMEDGVTYSWSSPDDPDFSSNTANPVVSPIVSTLYEVEASIADCSVIGSVYIEIIQPATLIAGEDQIITEDNTTVTLDAVLTGGGGNATTEWLWESDQEFISSDLVTTTIITSLSDDLPDNAIISYINACETLTDTIQFLKLEVEVPNIFSPNGDSKNAVFRPFYGDTSVDLVEVYVFNRWGQLVFESTDPTNPGWDGNVDGNPAPSDVYMYQVRVGKGEVIKESAGSITLIR